MDTSIPRRWRVRVLGFGSAIALVALLLPATAGIALGYTATATCNQITNDRDPVYGAATVYLLRTHTGGIALPASTTTVPGVAIVAPGSYWVLWGDGYTQGRLDSPDGQTSPLVVGKCSPSISTVASPTTGTVGVAGLVGDTATLSAPVTFVTGTLVTFTLYSDSGCSASTGVTGTGPLNASGVATFSQSWTPSVSGTYYWKASFPGDTYNSAVSACGGETEIVDVSNSDTTLPTTPTAGGGIGTVLNDSATVSGGSSPTGTITFSLYGPNDTSCDTTAIYTQTVALTGNSATTTPGFTTVAAGTYEWTASYAGDANNNAASSACGAEAVVVTAPGSKASPTLGTVPSAGGLIGTVLNDTATLTNASSPTGSIVFNLYGPGTSCTTTAIYTQTVALIGASAATTTGFTTTAAGTYEWTASYAGDANNNAANSGCGAEAVVITTPGKASPTLGTTPPPRVAGSAPSSTTARP